MGPSGNAQSIAPYTGRIIAAQRARRTIWPSWYTRRPHLHYRPRRLPSVEAINFAHINLLLGALAGWANRQVRRSEKFGLRNTASAVNAAIADRLTMHQFG